MTVNSHLLTTASSLVLSSAENSSITSSISTLKLRLASYFGSDISEHFQFGSSTRGTILPRNADSNSDIDYMVVFDTRSGQYKPQTYLDKLRRFAVAKYATSEIKQSHPTIVLSLNHISFELVPAINSYGYQIPSPSKDFLDWMHTNPAEANRVIREKNGRENSQIKPLVRLVKYWNAKNGHCFTPFSLESSIVETHFWGCSTLKDYFYFYWNSFNYSYDTPQYIKDKVDLAKRRIASAKNYEDSEYYAAAEVEIKKVIPEL